MKPIHSVSVSLFAVVLTLLTNGCSPSAGPGPGPANTNDNGNDNSEPVQFDECSTTGTEDDGIVFGEFGETRVVASTIGEGRHLVLASGQALGFELDQPVPFCAVVPDNVTIRLGSTTIEMQCFFG